MENVIVAQIVCSFFVDPLPDRQQKPLDIFSRVSNARFAVVIDGDEQIDRVGDTVLT